MAETPAVTSARIPGPRRCCQDCSEKLASWLSQLLYMHSKACTAAPRPEMEPTLAQPGSRCCVGKLAQDRHAPSSCWVHGRPLAATNPQGFSPDCSRALPPAVSARVAAVPLTSVSRLPPTPALSCCCVLWAHIHVARPHLPHRPPCRISSVVFSPVLP